MCEHAEGDTLEELARKGYPVFANDLQTGPFTVTITNLKYQKEVIYQRVKRFETLVSQRHPHGYLKIFHVEGHWVHFSCQAGDRIEAQGITFEVLDGETP